MTEEDKNKIEKHCADTGLSGNGKEILGAMTIIENALGREWCLASTNKQFRENKRRLFDSGKDHPLSKLLGAKEMESWHISQIIGFAACLENLSDIEGFKEKIKKYVGKKPSTEITFHDFESLFFELRVANSYKNSGLEVDLLKENNVPTPDLRIQSNNGSALLECKKKRYDNYSLSSVLDTIRKTNDEQLEPRGESGIIAVDLSLSPELFEIKKEELVGKILLLIKDMKLVNFVDLYNNKSWSHGIGMTKVGFQKATIENPHPKTELDTDIINAIFNPKELLHKSFFI